MKIINNYGKNNILLLLDLHITGAIILLQINNELHKQHHSFYRKTQQL